MITKKKILAASLSLAFSSQAFSASQPTTFVHLFEWNWQDIATECESFLGPKGYAAVQVSPPNEHIQGKQWWTRYQSVSYQLESRGGNRSQFIDMVNRCKAVGVNIYVDSLVNHMAAGSGTGTAGTSYGGKQFSNYSPQDFHNSCTINGEDYANNRWRVQNCELVGLPDLNTSSNYVQTKLADYLNDLTNIGVAGFRFDASKHMAVNDIKEILSKLNGKPLVFQEVIDQGGEAISSGEYTDTGLVTEFKYSTKLGDTFKNGSLSWLKNFGEAWGFLPSANAVVFVDNHDNQRGHGGGGSVITFEDGRLYDLANVFMLAYPYGYPKVMSSYDYHDDTDAGSPDVLVHNNGNLECFGSDWKCEHRWSYIAGAVDFRNHTADNWNTTNWWDNGHNQIAFGRGSSGHVAINKENSTMNETVQTSMAPGTYCNVLKGELMNNVCTGETVTVNDDGTINLNVAAWDAFAIHKDAQENCTANCGGGLPSLSFRGTANNWGTTALTEVSEGIWQTKISFDGQENQRFKFDVLGDWSKNYGDDNADGSLELAGEDIFTNVIGQYTVKVTESNLSYELIKNGQNFSSDLTKLFFRGTENNWKTTAMRLVADNTWEVEVDFNGQANQRFKFDVNGDWSENYGDTGANGSLEKTGSDIFTSVVGKYKIQVNDQNMTYQLITQ